MPAAIVAGIRWLIIALIQTGAFALLQKGLYALFDKAEKHNKEELGLDEEDSKAHLANSFIDIAAVAGITLLSLKTKLPVKVADRLGFTTKGFQKRKLSPSGEAKVKGKVVTSATTSKISPAEIDAASEVVASSQGRSVSTVRSLLNTILGFTGKIGVWFLIAGNFIDFANWNGAFQGTFQKLFSIVGLKPDNPMPKASVLSDDVWKRVSATVKELNPKTINFPWSGETEPYSLEGLVKLVNQVAAQMVAAGDQPTFKSVMAVVLPLIQLGGVTKANSSSSTVSLPSQSSGAGTLSQYYASIGKSLPSVSARAKIYQDMGLGQASFYTGTAEQNTKLLNALKGTSQQSSSGTYQWEKSDVEGGKELIYYPPGVTPNTELKLNIPVITPASSSAPSVPAAPSQVFMGVVAGGTLSNNVVFSERPDDLIESFDEFQSAAQNNLSLFLLGITNRISYELKIVPSVVTAGGFRQTGTTNRYITGYNKDGSPKYKTITNKFATLTIYILNDKNTRTKIGTIVLGPTDASKITPSQTDLRQLEALIQNSIITRNIDEISRIETSTPTTIVPPSVGTTEQSSTPPPPPTGDVEQIKISGQELSFFGGNIPEGGSWARDEGVFINRGGTFYRVGDDAVLVGV